MNIRLLTYNIHKGFKHFNSQFVLREIKKSLQETKADILCLQEVVGQNDRHKKQIENWPDESQYEYLADQVWDHYAYGKNAVTSKSDHGNAILSQYPIKSFENVKLSMNRFEHRGLLHAKLDIPERQQELSIFTTHLNLMASDRKKQIQMVIQHIQNVLSPEKDAFILAGDFNDWNCKLTPHLEEQLGVKEAFVEYQGAYAKSFPSFIPQLKLDRIYFRGLSLNTALAYRGKEWSQLSDHLPLLAEFTL